ncbi:MAG: cold shock domain-containing protein [Candidatus Omnitrophica bacterium]|nr:cold shock domain-containing protein [Candidatus Omnitrophota bacterium]
MNTGIITKYFPKDGYGLIEDDSGQEHFFYTRDLEQSCSSEIKEGERVEFDPSLWNHYHAVHLCAEHQELETRVRSLRK